MRVILCTARNEGGETGAGVFILVTEEKMKRKTEERRESKICEIQRAQRELPESYKDDDLFCSSLKKKVLILLSPCREKGSSVLAALS